MPPPALAIASSAFCKAGPSSATPSPTGLKSAKLKVLFGCLRWGRNGFGANCERAEDYQGHARSKVRLSQKPLINAHRVCLTGRVRKLGGQLAIKIPKRRLGKPLSQNTGRPNNAQQFFTLVGEAIWTRWAIL